MTKPIYPCIWFDGQAKEAAKFYCSIFPNSRITEDTPMVVRWELNGQLFMGLNGGPKFFPNEAVSFVVECETQQEIDHYWEALSREGREDMCGWLKDKFGVSWQIVPAVLAEMMKNPERSQKVIDAFLKMRKFDIAILQKAYEP